MPSAVRKDRLGYHSSAIGWTDVDAGPMWLLLLLTMIMMTVHAAGAHRITLDCKRLTRRVATGDERDMFASSARHDATAMMLALTRIDQWS